MANEVLGQVIKGQEPSYPSARIALKCTSSWDATLFWTGIYTRQSQPDPSVRDMGRTLLKKCLTDSTYSGKWGVSELEVSWLRTQWNNSLPGQFISSIVAPRAEGDVSEDINWTQTLGLDRKQIKKHVLNSHTLQTASPGHDDRIGAFGAVKRHMHEV